MVKRKQSAPSTSNRPQQQQQDPSQKFSEAAIARAEGLRSEAAARDPDRFDVYIFNDFHAYGCAEVLENALNLVHAKAAAKEYKSAFSVLEGLTHWCARDSTFTTMDDGERCNNLVRLLLSAWVDVAKTGNAEVKDIVNYRFVLGETVKLGKALQGCGIVSQGHNALQDLLDGKEVKATSKKEDPNFYDFDALYKDYVKDYGKDGKIGGETFDLSKKDAAQLKAEHGLQSDEDDSEGEAGSLPQMMLTTMNETLAAQGRPLMTMEDVHGILMRSFMGGGVDDDDEDEDEDEEDEDEGEEEEEPQQGEEQGDKKAGSTSGQQAPGTSSKKARK